jgi:phenylacetate-coenzyme A ligase PaaK-like adenylate-forming protein
MNWRKPILRMIAAVQGTRIFPYYREILSYQTAGREEIHRRTSEKLRRLLHHAWEHVPYYREILPRCGVIRDGRPDLERFTDIPILTKEIIRREAAQDSPFGSFRTRNTKSGTSLPNCILTPVWGRISGSGS